MQDENEQYRMAATERLMLYLVISDQSMTQSSVTESSSLNSMSKFLLYSKKLLAGLGAILQGFYLVFRHRLYKDPNNPNNTRYVQHFCRQLSKVFNIEVQIHGQIPRQPALWVSNHISWLDVAVLGSGARVFFLAKAEMKNGHYLENWLKVAERCLLNAVLVIQLKFVNKLPPS